MIRWGLNPPKITKKQDYVIIILSTFSYAYILHFWYNAHPQDFLHGVNLDEKSIVMKQASLCDLKSPNSHIDYFQFW